MAVKKTGKAAENAAQGTADGLRAQEAPAGGMTPAAENAAQEAVRLAYIGPTLPVGQLKKNAVFIGTADGIRNELGEALEAYPLAWKLMVPVERMGEKKARAGTAGTALNKYCSCLVSEIAANKAKEGR